MPSLSEVIEFPDEEWVIRFFNNVRENLTPEKFMVDGPFSDGLYRVLVVSRDGQEADVTWSYHPEQEVHSLRVVTSGEGTVLVDETGTLDDLLPVRVWTALVEWFGPPSWWHRLNVLKDSSPQLYIEL